MALIKLKPTSAGRRHAVKVVNPATKVALDKKKTSRYLRAHGMEKKYCHLERFYWIDEEGQYRQGGEPLWFLFDYEHRDALTGDAVCRIVDFSNILPV